MLQIMQKKISICDIFIAFVMILKKSDQVKSGVTWFVLMKYEL